MTDCKLLAFGWCASFAVLCLVISGYYALRDALERMAEHDDENWGDPWWGEGV